MISLVLAVVTSTGATQAPINNENFLAEQPVVASQQVSQQEAKPEEVPKERRDVTWRDNPHKCNLQTQYVRKDNLKCIDKPVVSQKHTTSKVGCSYYRDLVSQYRWNVDVALKVMRAESGCNPSAVGDNRVIGGIFAPSCGLFQVRTLAGRPNCAQLKNPETNVKWAYRLYQANGWQPWTVCTKGLVSCY